MSKTKLLLIDWDLFCYIMFYTYIFLKNKFLLKNITLEAKQQNQCLTFDSHVHIHNYACGYPCSCDDVLLRLAEYKRNLLNTSLLGRSRCMLGTCNMYT